MKILRQQTLPFGEEKSTSSPGDFRASHFQSQGNVKVQPITVTSGRKCLEQFERFAQNGSWAKTFSELLIGMEGWYSSRCTLTWKLKSTRYKRLFFQLAVSTPRTNDTERGLLLKTPSAMDARSERLTKKEQRFGNSGTLAQEVQTGFIYKRGLLPTVQTQGLKRCNAAGKTEFLPLELLPTPQASDGQGGAAKVEGMKIRRPTGQVFSATLRYLAGNNLLLTPRANKVNDIDLNNTQMAQRNKGNLEESIAKIIQNTPYKDGKISQLNPLFVADMMGFPTTWCDI